MNDKNGEVLGLIAGLLLIAGVILLFWFDATRGYAIAFTIVLVLFNLVGALTGSPGGRGLLLGVVLALIFPFGGDDCE